MNSTLETRKNFAQPRALYLLFFAQMWECFSFYGMRALLVLFMIEQLHFADAQAFGIYSVYCALIEIGGIFGGRLADRLFGLRLSIFVGGWLIAAGHVTLLLSESNPLFFLGLGLIACGTSLFSTNISTLLGQFYGEEDPRREKGYTLFYMGINLGGLLATLICGWAAELYGWHIGFGLAAFGMFVGNITLMLLRNTLEDKGLKPQNSSNSILLLGCVAVAASIPLYLAMLMDSAFFLPVMPALCFAAVAYALITIYRSGLVTVADIAIKTICLVALALFFAAEEQIGSALILFSERFSDGSIAHIEVPTSVLLSINPFVIICLGSSVAYLCQKGRWQGMIRLSLGCCLGGCAFVLFSCVALFNPPGQLIPMAYILIGVVMISLGELFVAPTIYAFFSGTTPPSLQGITMGLIPLGYALASVLNGLISQAMASEGDPIQNYGYGFSFIGCVLLVASLGLIAIKMIKKEEKYGIS